MIEWPEQLKADLAGRKVVIYLGSGVSKNSLSRDGARRPPLWAELLNAALEKAGPKGTRHIKSAINNNDLLHACEWLKKKLDEEWIDFLRGELVEPVYEAAEIHDTIFRLDQRIYLTPNFDNIFESYVQSQTGAQAIVKRHCEGDVASFLRDDNLYIIKIHGSINNPSELIFSQKDYAAARVKHSAFYEALDACLLTHTFLFIGCGVADPDIALLLENQKFNFPHARPHYFITPSKISSDLIASLRENRNLKVVCYNDKNNHEALQTSLKALQEEVDNLRVTHPSSTR